MCGSILPAAARALFETKIFGFSLLFDQKIDFAFLKRETYRCLASCDLLTRQDEIV